MSIIHEALKKVQANRSSNTRASENIIVPGQKSPVIDPKEKVSSPPGPIPNTTPSPSEIELAKSGALWDKWLWLFFILVLSAITCFQAFKLTREFNDLDRQAKTPLKAPSGTTLPRSETSPSPNPETPTTSLPTPTAPRVFQKGEIILFGTSQMDGTNFALINDGIYKVGEEVEGYRLSTIGEDYIIVEKDGQSKTLQTRHK